MKLYFSIIAITQKILMAVSVALLLTLPFGLAFYPDTFTYTTTGFLYAISHYFLLFVMLIRPLADLVTKTKWLRPLVILRKGAGVFSASIIFSFLLSKIIIDPCGYFSSFATSAYWSLDKFMLFAHLADISAFFLLITSNRFSKLVLGKWWKRTQKLSYVYFFGSSLYLYFALEETIMLYFMALVSLITTLAFIKNKNKNK